MARGDRGDDGRGVRCLGSALGRTAAVAKRADDGGGLRLSMVSLPASRMPGRPTC